MAEPVQILTVKRDGEDGLLVTFSDGTITGYVTEELLELRPCREPTGEPLYGVGTRPRRSGTQGMGIAVRARDRSSSDGERFE
jgi:hypothetical protein